MPSTTSWLRLKNLSFWGQHGHSSSERALGNRLELDVELKTDFSEAAQSDNLDLSIDLRAVYEIARHRIEKESFALIETLSMTIAQDLMDTFTAESVTVRLRKVAPPLPGATTGVMEAEVTLVP